MSTRYEVGQKVVIANEETLRHVLYTVSEMYKYAGTTMTIYTTHSGSVTCPYYMVEDENDNSGRRWHWSDGMIDHEATARLMETAEPEPKEFNEFSVDYYTNKVYDMFNRFARNGALIDRANKFTKDGIRKNVEEWLNMKAPLFRLLRKHPNWNEEAKAVVYHQTEHRMPSSADSESAFSHLIEFCGYDHIESGTTPWDNVYTCFSEMSQIDWQTMINKSHICNWSWISDSYVDSKRLFATVFLALFSQEPMNTMSKEVADCVNRIYPDIRAHVGQKTSRIANKLFCKFGFDKTPNYNREFAKLADSMNPFDVERITVLSANIIDFLLMSNGNSWRSCHTILSGGPDNYGGCYMGGTLSYANDSESMIFYTVDKDYHGTDYCFEPKINRQIFFWSYPVLVQERLYPQCNDDTEQGKALVKQYRTVVEDIFATCLETPNLWVRENRNRASVCNRDDTFMYDDWNNFPNYIVHLKKEISVSENEVEESSDTEDCDFDYVIRSAKHISVGGTSYCINCGAEKCEDEFEDRDNSHNGLLCHKCHPDEETVYCNECDCCNDRDDMHCIDGEWYCDNCCFYCEYHQEYETGDYTYVENYGNVCEDGLYIGDFCCCDQCGEWHYADPTTTVYDRYDDEIEVCDDCLKKYYIQCDDCEDYFHRENIFYLNSDCFCEACYDKHMENEETEESESSEEVTA